MQILDITRKSKEDFKFIGKCPVCESKLHFYKGEMESFNYIDNKYNELFGLTIKCPVCGTYLDGQFNVVNVIRMIK